MPVPVNTGHAGPSNVDKSMRSPNISRLTLYPSTCLVLRRADNSSATVKMGAMMGGSRFCCPRGLQGPQVIEACDLTQLDSRRRYHRIHIWYDDKSRPPLPLPLRTTILTAPQEPLASFDTAQDPTVL